MTRDTVLIETPACSQPEMLLALGANLPVRFEVLLPDDRAAAAALHPQPFGPDSALVDGRRIFNRLLFALEPRHD